MVDQIPPREEVLMHLYDSLNDRVDNLENRIERRLNRLEGVHMGSTIVIVGLIVTVLMKFGG